MRLLLIEDDPLIGAAIEQAMQDAAYAVDWVRDGQRAISAATVQEYSLLLLDLGLPKRDGFTVLNTLRQQKLSCPVIMITARDAVEDRIHGLDLGADDYLVKPFSIAELAARIRAVLRRHYGNTQSVLDNAVLSLDTIGCQVTRDGETYPLSAREYALLRTLMLQPGRVFSRTELEEQLYGWNEEIASNAIEFIIHGLRKKLGKDAIKNIRGLGWMVSK